MKRIPVKTFCLAFAKYIREQSTGSIGDNYLCKDLARQLGREEIKGTPWKFFTEEQLWDEFIKQHAL